MADDTASDHTQKDLQTSAPRFRRPYVKPKLIEYGSVAKLTQGTRTKSADTPAAGFKKVCL